MAPFGQSPSRGPRHAAGRPPLSAALRDIVPAPRIGGDVCAQPTQFTSFRVLKPSSRPDRSRIVLRTLFRMPGFPRTGRSATDLPKPERRERVHLGSRDTTDSSDHVGSSHCGAASTPMSGPSATRDSGIPCSELTPPRPGYQLNPGESERLARMTDRSQGADQARQLRPIAREPGRKRHRRTQAHSRSRDSADRHTGSWSTRFQGPSRSWLRCPRDGCLCHATSQSPS